MQILMLTRVRIKGEIRENVYLKPVVDFIVLGYFVAFFLAIFILLGFRLGTVHRCCHHLAQQEPEWCGLHAVGFVRTKERRSHRQGKLHTGSLCNRVLPLNSFSEHKVVHLWPNQYDVLVYYMLDICLHQIGHWFHRFSPNLELM